MPPEARVVECNEICEVVAKLSNVVIDTDSIDVIPWIASRVRVVYRRGMNSGWKMDRVSVHGRTNFLVFKCEDIPDHSRFDWLREFVRVHQPLAVSPGRTRT